MAKATGGYFFAPRTLATALQLNELETLLSQAERKAPTIRRITSSYDLSYRHR